MIPRTPQLISITELRKDIDAALEMVERAPVYIVKHSKIIAIMVAYRTWEQVTEDIAAAEKELAEAKEST